MNDVGEVLDVPINWDRILEELKKKKHIVCGEMFESDLKPPNMTRIIWDGKEFSVPYFFVNAVTTEANKRGIQFFMNFVEERKEFCFGERR